MEAALINTSPLVSHFKKLKPLLVASLVRSADILGSLRQQHWEMNAHGVPSLHFNFGTRRLHDRDRKHTRLAD